MRRTRSALAALALIALARAPLPAQHADSAAVGRWSGRAELTTSGLAQRAIDVRIDIQPSGAVSGTVGEAVLVDATIYTDSRVARVLRLGREFAIEGRLAGTLIPADGIQRERIRFSLDRVLDRLTGDLQTSGTYDGPLSRRLITARVELDRVGAMVAGTDGKRLPLTRASVDSPSP